MADHRAIRGVSATLRTLLRDRMENEVSVTLLPPDVEPADQTTDRVNLFLYRITENPYLANQDTPGTGHPGLPGQPPLSLNLHYLLTAYSSAEPDEDARALELMGDAMRVFHEAAYISENLLRARETPGEPVLDVSLRGEFEKVKLRLETVSLEDISQVWSAFTVPYRLSVSYAVSVVQIESQAPRRIALPVETRRIHVTTLKRPQITRVGRAAEPQDARLVVGEELVIEGTAFRGQDTWVRIGRLAAIWIPQPTNQRLTISIPDDAYPQHPADPSPNPPTIPVEERLQPGPQEVEVRVRRRVEVIQGGLGSGEFLREDQIQYSNRSVLMLVPAITGVNPATGGTGDLLTVTGARLYHPELRSYVLVGDVMIEIREPDPGDPWAGPTATSVQVPLTALSELETGVGYPVRVMVNGAQSRGLEHVFQRI